MARRPCGIVDGDADVPRGALPAGPRPCLARSRGRSPLETTTKGGASRLDLCPCGRLGLLPVRGGNGRRRQGRERDRGCAVRTDRPSRGDRHRETRTYRERRRVMKQILALVSAVVAAGIVVTAGSAGPTERGGGLHVTKECSQYQGGAGQFCTITSSNISAIKPGSRVFYASAANFP